MSGGISIYILHLTLVILCPFSGLLLFNLLSVISTTIYLDCWKFIPLGCIENRQDQKKQKTKRREKLRNRKRAETLHSSVRRRRTFHPGRLGGGGDLRWIDCVGKPQPNQLIRMRSQSSMRWHILRKVDASVHGCPATATAGAILTLFCAWLLGSCLRLCLTCLTGGPVSSGPRYFFLLLRGGGGLLFTWWAYCGQGWTLACFWSWVLLLLLLLLPETWILCLPKISDHHHHFTFFFGELKFWLFVCRGIRKVFTAFCLTDASSTCLLSGLCFPSSLDFDFWHSVQFSFGVCLRVRVALCPLRCPLSIVPIVRWPYLNDLTRTMADPETDSDSPTHSSITGCVDFNLCASTLNATPINYSKLPTAKPPVSPHSSWIASISSNIQCNYGKCRFWKL